MSGEWEGSLHYYRRLALSCSLVLMACGDSTAPVEVASVTLTVPSTTLIAGELMQASAIAKDASGNPLPDRPIQWSSTNDAVARVSVSGLVTSIAPGMVDISARSGSQTGHVVLTV